MNYGKLMYRNFNGILIRRDGLLDWRCDICKNVGTTMRFIKRCPFCFYARNQ
jgi:hypothetical protein